MQAPARSLLPSLMRRGCVVLLLKGRGESICWAKINCFIHNHLFIWTSGRFSNSVEKT